MKNNNCLSEQDLILYYYAEHPANNEQARHLTNCPLCMKQFDALSQDLDKLPKLAYEPDPLSGTRMAARVNEQLNRRSRSWAPALGASALAALALVVTFTQWSPQQEYSQTTEPSTPLLTTMTLNEDMPEIDFLEDLELLKNLELLSQIEGV